MKRLSLICLLLLIVTGVPAASVTNQPVRVLFIGNSLTYGNNLPDLVSALIRRGTPTSAGRPCQIVMIAKPAYTLGEHYQEQPTLSAIQTGRWDYVVLQDQSSMPAMAPEVTRKAARQLADRIRASGAQTIFFMTWGFPGRESPVTKLDLGDELAKTYELAATENKASLAPVGRAFAAVLAAKPDYIRRLYGSDSLHPSQAGTYLAACVFYATITGKSPVGLSTAYGLPAEDCRFLQEIAWKSSPARQ